MKPPRLLLAGAAFCGLTVLSAFAQSTAFTYQGRLHDGPNPATGLYDLRFGVWNSPDTGNSTQLGMITNAATPVTNGLFTVTLDFGGVWSGGGRLWLELAARTNGAVSFNTLGPRQYVAPAPYATYADTASAVGLRGFISGGQISSGSIGSIHLSNNLSLWNRSGSNLYYQTGNVGIGTATPLASLHVAGPMKVQGRNPLEFGTGLPGKDVRAGNIGYESYTPGALDVVGAGTNAGGRVVQLWDHLQVSGTVAASNYFGSGSGLTGIAAANVDGTLGAAQIPNLDAAKITTGALADTRLSANVALRSGANTFLGDQTVTNGRVGIGTASPDRPLAIQGVGVNGEWLSLKAPDGATRWHLNHSRGGLDFVQTGVADARLFLATNGNTGIGTLTPSSRLDVAGGIRARGGAPGSNGASDNGYGFQGPGDSDSGLFSLGDGQLSVFINNTERVRVGSGGNVGIGTTNPAASLHVLGSGFFGNHQEGLSSAAGAGVRVFRDTTTGTGSIFAYDYGAGASLNLILQQAGGNVGIGTTTPATRLDVAGDVTAVAYNITSDRNAKEEFRPVNPEEVLAKVARLPISEWQYKKQGDVRHLGPMAQDFRAAFALGLDEKHIATVDADGVALAAIQGLNNKLEKQISDKDRRIAELERAMADLKVLVQRLAADREGVTK